MTKADDKVDYGEVELAPYTYFEELQKRVEQLQNIVNIQTEILRQNNLVARREEQAPFFDDDALYQELIDSILDEESNVLEEVREELEIKKLKDEVDKHQKVK
jgi:uncharacterized protein YwgA